ncbi:MAG: hypothetical protein KAH32_09165 [Chlamydiia bacterium]|nr:hypothetical protein [Chlamydiia bacterium]
MDTHNIHEGNLTIFITNIDVGGGIKYRVKEKSNNHRISTDRNNPKFDNSVRKNLLVHEYFHLVQQKAIYPMFLKANWISEGTAKSFEDYGTFDGDNS